MTNNGPKNPQMYHKNLNRLVQIWLNAMPIIGQKYLRKVHATLQKKSQPFGPKIDKNRMKQEYKCAVFCH